MSCAASPKGDLMPRVSLQNQWFSGLLASLMAVVLSGCGPSSESVQPSENVSKTVSPEVGIGNDVKPKIAVELALNWFPEAEHGGFYAALVHGYFESEGLDVTITPGGPNVPVIQNVATGRVQFAIANADQVLVGRARDADVVAVLAPLQTSPRCIMVHEKSGIRSFADLKNIKLAINSNSTFALFLMKNVPLEGCTIVAYPGNVAQFLLEDAFAQQAYVFSEPFVAKQQGGDPSNLLVADIGFNPYTSVLIASGETIQKQPALVQKIVLASRRGWVTYLSDPASTNKLIHEKNPEMGLDVLEFGVGELKKLCYSESVTEANFGHMTAERWAKLSEQLVSCEVYEASQAKSTEAFTTQFLTSP